jgi:hypothetical protein
MAAYPRLRLRAVSPETELDSAALRRAESALAIVLRPLAVRTAAEWARPPVGSAKTKAVASRPLVVRPVAELESAASLQAEEMFALHPPAASVPERARLSAELAVWARRLAGPVASAAQAAARLLEAPAVAWDAAVVPQQAVAAWV